MMSVAVASLLAVLCVLVHRASSDPCPFNPLCSCAHRDVSCIGVPFAEVPPLPLDDIFQLTLIKAGVEVLHDHSFQNTRISSLRLMQNQVSHIHSRAFQGSERALTTLDLSFNRMHRLPIEALHRLHHLQWLSLHANDIDEWPPLPPAPHLRSVFAGDNRIAALPEGAFSALRNLSSLDLDSNCLAEVGRASLPPSLHTLSLSNNLLKKVPEPALRHLANLTWLQLGGNLIEDLPKPFRLPVRTLHKLDLSHNLLADLNSVFRNDTSDPTPTLVSNLHLEFNYITQLHASAFAGLSLERLSLSNNKLSSVPEGVFDGLQDSLKALDLSHNLLEEFPKALRDLAALSHLFLRGNLIGNLDPQDLYGCRYDLEVLDLSGNRLRRVPSESLRTTQRVARLSLQDNAVSRIEEDDFSTWGHSLTALNLANNRLHHVAPNAFAGTTKLRELRLSYNRLLELDPAMFLPLRPTLEVLEIGALQVPSLAILEGMAKVKWLQMDHSSRLAELPRSAFEGMPALIHCDLEGNRLLRGSLPAGLFRGALHGRLNSVVLANSGLEEVEADAFHKLPSVTNIVLFGNKLKVLRTGSFRDMPLLNTVILAQNEISRLEPGAFTNLRSATHLLLQDNQLTEFSFDAFRQVGDAKSQVLLDLSRNRIAELRGLQQDDSNLIVQKTSNSGGFQDGEVFLRVRTLDLSHNLVSRLDGEFLKPVGRTLHHLVLSHNRIKHLDTTTFQHAPNLQILHLDGNLLSHLPNGAFSGCPGLQALHAGHNNLSRAFSGAFRNLSALRILDLSNNALKELPEDLFLGTSLERLNLSANSVFSVPLPALSHARTTLRYLDLSRNRVGSLPPMGRLHNLLGLNLSGNALKGMPEDAFHQMVYLLHLDLSHNALYRLDEDPFRPLVSLQSLLLSGSRLQQLPAFPLPSLRSLALAGNALRNVSEASFSRLRELRELDLSRNQLQEVPSHVWGAVGGRLARLDLSGNPIQTLSANHFRRLERLRELDLRDLDLKYLDSRILHNLRFLTSFKTSTYAGLRSFRLQTLLNRSSSLRRVVVEVEEQTLSHQLQWAFGPKLRELTVTGRKLQHVLPDAFQGLRTHELVLRITGTSIRELPKGLLRYLADIRYLTLDVRGNLLSSMDPDVLSPAPRIRTDGHTTQHISGGVLLEDNPWACGCGIVWIGAWIRRWMRETLRVQMLHFEGFLYAQSLARRTLCTMPGGNNSSSPSSMPLVELHPALFGCREDEEALSSAGTASVAVPHCWTLLAALVVCWQCSVFFRWCRCKKQQRTS